MTAQLEAQEKEARASSSLSFFPPHVPLSSRSQDLSPNPQRRAATHNDAHNTTTPQVEVVLNQLEPWKLKEYEQLIRERRELGEEASRLEKELAAAAEQRDRHKAEIDQDNTRARYHAISRQIGELNARKGRSSELLKSLQLSPEEQGRGYLRAIREENEELSRIEQETRGVAEAIRAADGKLAGVRSDWQAQHGSEAAEKLEKLIKRDHELSERLGAFSAQQEAIQAEVMQREGNIFRLLERMSRAISAKESLPDRGRMRELEQELRYKQQQLGAAKARRGDGRRAPLPAVLHTTPRRRSSQQPPHSHCNPRPQTTATMLTGEQAARQAELDRAKNAIPEMQARSRAARVCAARRSPRPSPAPCGPGAPRSRAELRGFYPRQGFFYVRALRCPLFELESPAGEDQGEAAGD